MLAVIASYLMLRAWPDGRWRVAGLRGGGGAETCQHLGLMTLAAHVGHAAADRRPRPGRDGCDRRIPLRWADVGSAVVIVRLSCSAASASR